MSKSEADVYEQKRSAKIKDMSRSKDDTGVYYITTNSKTDGYGNSKDFLEDALKSEGVNISKTFKNQKVAFIYHSPRSISRSDCEKNILYSMFESDKIPDSWIEDLKKFDEIVVPSKFCYKAFKKAGFESKVVPLGVCAKTYKYKKRKTAIEENRDFVFLHYNAFNVRKGFIELFQAFNDAFKNTDAVKLILKTTLNNLPLPIAPQIYPNIEIVRGKIDNDEMLKLLHRADCFVYPSRGEGFGLPPLEAGSTGITSIVPDAHGIAEYFDASAFYEVKVEKACKALYTRYKKEDTGKMIVCDVDDLAQKMREAYENQKKIKLMGEKARDVANKYSWERCAKNLKRIITAVEKKEVTGKTKKLNIRKVI